VTVKTSATDVFLGGVAMCSPKEALKEMSETGNEQAQGLYAHACQFQEQGRLEEAEKLFRFLCIYDFYNSHYWMGLAAVYQVSGHYRKAIELYAVAFAQDRGDYRPMFYTGECQLALGAQAKARDCFDYVLRQAVDGELPRRSRAYLEDLQADSMPSCSGAVCGKTSL